MMKKIFLSLALVVMVFIKVGAQVPKHFDVFGGEAMEIIKATPEQKKQVTELIKEFSQQTKAVRDNTALSDDEKKVQLRKLNMERGKRFWENILNEEQAKVLKEKQKERFEERQKAIKATQ